MSEHEEKRIPRPEEILEDHEELSEELRLKPPRCPAGSSTEHKQCWREAKVTRHERLYCEEHARLFDLATEEMHWGVAEDVTGGWLAVAEAWDHDALIRLARRVHEEAKAQAVKAAARADLAKEIANAPPPGEGKPRLSLAQEEKLSGLVFSADAFVDAYAAVEDDPDFSDEERRRRVMGVLAAAQEAAEEKHSRYRAELGLSE